MRPIDDALEFVNGPGRGYIMSRTKVGRKRLKRLKRAIRRGRASQITQALNGTVTYRDKERRRIGCYPYDACGRCGKRLEIGEHRQWWKRKHAGKWRLAYAACMPDKRCDRGKLEIMLAG